MFNSNNLWEYHFVLDAGEAFFDFFRIKSCIERNNGDVPLMWALENSDSYHITISR